MTRALVFLSAFLLSASGGFAQTPAVPAAASAATSADTPAVQEFQKIVDLWSDAINNRDQYGLELVLSPLFVDISATGDITTRNQQVAQLLSGEDKTLHIEQRVITVRLLGDIAVANGTYSMRHKGIGGEVNEKGVFTHVFQRSRAGWLCINAQRTVVREDSNVKPKHSSNAEMPFHIPLVSK